MNPEEVGIGPEGVKISPEGIKSVYIEAILQKAALCNSRIHQTWFWFTGFAVTGCLVRSSSTATISVLGESIAIPRTLFVVTLPIVLSALYYGMSCYASLEDEYYKEMRKALGSGIGPASLLTLFEVKLLEAPSFYTYSELRRITGTSRLFTIASVVADYLIRLTAVLAPVVVVGYFTIEAVSAFGCSWVSAIQLVAVFLTLFGLVQYREKLGN